MLSHVGPSVVYFIRITSSCWQLTKFNFYSLTLVPRLQIGAVRGRVLKRRVH